MVSSHPGPGLETDNLLFLNRSKPMYQISPLVKNKTGLIYRQSGTLEPVPGEVDKIVGENPVELNISAL